MSDITEILRDGPVPRHEAGIAADEIDRLSAENERLRGRDKMHQRANTRIVRENNELRELLGTARNFVEDSDCTCDRRDPSACDRCKLLTILNAALAAKAAP